MKHLHTCVRLLAFSLMLLAMTACRSTVAGGSGWPIIAVQSKGDVVARTDVENFLVGGSGNAQVFAIAKGTSIPVLLASVDGGKVWMKHKGAHYEATLPIVQDPILGSTVTVPHFMGQLFPAKSVLPDGRVGETVGNLTVLFTPPAP